MILATTSWGHRAEDLTALTVTAVAFLALGIASVRLFGCGQCRAVHDQELTLIKRLLGDRELYVHRHALRRNRPFTCAETLELLDTNAALLTSRRWKDLEAQRKAWNALEFRHGRDLLSVESADRTATGGHTSNGIGAL